MNRILLLLMILLGCIPKASADHITGGEISYLFLGTSDGNYKYLVTVRMFMRCHSGREFNNPTVIAVFDKSSGQRFKDYSVNLSHSEVLDLNSTDPCIINPPAVCYEVGYYQFEMILPGSAAGYVLTSHVNFRIDGINNLINNYDRIGATYVGEIPSNTIEGAPHNTSAQFVGEDLVIVCAQNSFTYNFGAKDADGDELRYSFCNAYKTSGDGGFGNNVMPPPPPPYSSVPYGNGFGGTMPLGDKVKIDSKTGVITGIAPRAGTYIVTVCVEEIRNGEIIATQRKDLQINIAPCSVTGATLPDDYMLCKETKTLTVKNFSTSPLINSYSWVFTDVRGNEIFSSTASSPTYTFEDTGTYKIRLTINENQLCSDSAVAYARVYPGFTPGFSISGSCISNPITFTDASSSALGTVNKWSWDFGESTTTQDISADQNPVYNYLQKGPKTISLIAEDNLGCKDTSSRTVEIFDKPPIDLAFRDTLICPPDQLQLRANGKGSFSWSPQTYMSDVGSATPSVSPLANTMYYVELNDDGCVNTDSVSIRVVNQVSLTAMADTLICEGDDVRLHLQTNGLKFTWSPAVALNDPFSSTPFATPQNSTTYMVTASISACTASDDVTVTTVPYPFANAGADTSICFNTAAQLHATTDGSSFNWSPPGSLEDPNTLIPVVHPIASTNYILYAYDTKGCPKAGTDTVFVHVEAQIVPNAGRDTIAVINQPLQMQASGGALYHWEPATGLSAADIPNPVAQYSRSPDEGNYTYKVLVSDATGCVDSAYVSVKVFETRPEIYVPSAFTPNSDGKNDYFQVVAAGIRQVEMFQVYSRWGQLVYSSPIAHSLGWDGMYGGKPQPIGTYVWVIKATDYLGNPMVRKGTVTLIR